MAKVYITKWALTRGIEVVETASDTSKHMIGFKNGAYTYRVYGGDWHTTQAKAVARAEEMRLRKVASLEKSLERMRSLTFPLTPAEP